MEDFANPDELIEEYLQEWWTSSSDNFPDVSGII